MPLYGAVPLVPLSGGTAVGGGAAAAATVQFQSPTTTTQTSDAAYSDTPTKQPDDAVEEWRNMPPVFAQFQTPSRVMPMDRQSGVFTTPPAAAAAAAAPQPPPPPPHAESPRRVVVTAASKPSALSSATRVGLFGDSSILRLSPRAVPPWWWLLAYTLPLLFWLFATAWAGAKGEVFFTPDASGVSDSWVQGGWILAWLALVVYVSVLVMISVRRSPFSSVISIGTLVLLGLSSMAAIAHSNALRVRDVLSPLTNDKAIIVQSEWLAVALLLLVFLAVVYDTPRHITSYTMAQLAVRTKEELAAVTNQLQTEVASLEQMLGRTTDTIAVVQQTTPDAGTSAPTARPPSPSRTTISDRASFISPDHPSILRVEDPRRVSRAESRSHAAETTSADSTDDPRAMRRNTTHASRVSHPAPVAARSIRTADLPSGSSSFLTAADFPPKPPRHRKTRSHMPTTTAPLTVADLHATSDDDVDATGDRRGSVAGGTDFFERAQSLIRQQQEEARALEMG